MDPGETALDAEVFWRAEDYSRALSAYVRSTRSPGLGSIIALADLPCRRTLLKIAGGGQHLLLRDRSRVAQVRCIGEDIRVDPFALELVVAGFPDTAASQRLIQRLGDLCRGRPPAGTKSAWTVEAMRHRDALAAFDRRREGCSYRQIALFLCGEKAVREDWARADQSMKNRVIRSVKRGRRMVGGGYRKLLA